MFLARPGRWLAPTAWLALAACGTAGAPSPPAPQPGPVASLSEPAPSAMPTATVQCPEDQDHEPGKGCVYLADGTPPQGKGATMWPIPGGRIGEAVDGTMVPSFWIDERAVTVANYLECVKAGPCGQPATGEYCPWGVAGKEAEPAECVSWHHAEAYCAWAGKRLPTDSEWDRLAPKHEGYGVTGLGGEQSEWTASYYCSEKIGGCGHSRVLRGYREPAARERSLPTLAHVRFAFRCAWSERAPRSSEAPPPQVPLVTTTPGKVLCNTTSCDLSISVCCHNTVDGVGHCVPKGKRSCSWPELWSTCDEHADCAGGKNCCPSSGCSGGCPEERICVDGPCEQGDEICLPGGNCRTGFECQTEPGARRGYCRWANVGAWCGTKRCSGDKPLCCLPDGKSVGYCSADQCKPRERRLLCASPKDCGGSTCGSNFFMAAPPEVNDGTMACIQQSHVLNQVACESVRDCPRHPPSGALPKACGHTDGLPRGVKECIFDHEY